MMHKYNNIILNILLKILNVTGLAKTVPITHLVFRETPIWNIKATVVLLC